MASDKKSTQAVDKKLFADLQLTDEVIGNDYQADGVTVIGTCRIPLGDLLRKGLVVLDAPLATVNAANTVTATGPILGQTTDDKLVVKWAQTAGTDGWSTPFASTAQGALADTALQPSDVVDDLTTGGTAVPGSAEQLKVLKGQVDGKASTAQGALADTALQPSDNVSDLTNDANYIGAVADLSTRLAVPDAYRGSRAQGLIRLHNRLKTEIATQDSNRLMVLQIGDSIAPRLSKFLQSRHLAQWYPEPASVKVHSDVGTGPYGKGGNIVGKAGTGTWTINTDWDLNWSGSYATIASGQHMHFGTNNTQIMWGVDRVLLPYVIESGAGSFRVRLGDVDATMTDVNHANWADPSAGEVTQGPALTAGELIVDCSGAYALGMIELSFSALRGLSLQVQHSAGGTVRVMAPMFETNRIPTVNFYHLAEGGTEHQNVTSTSDPLMAKLISDLSPDIITLHSDDGGTAADNIMDRIKAALDASTLSYVPLVIAIGGGPKNGADAAMKAQNDALGSKASQYNYGFYSMLDLVPTYAAIDDLGWGGDGTHLDETFYELGAAEVAKFFKFDAARAGLADTLGIRHAAKLPQTMDLNEHPFGTVGTVGSATYTLDAPYWEFSTGATANSEITRYLNDFGGPFQFRGSSYQVSYNQRQIVSFWVQLVTANSEGEFWLHYGGTGWNAAYAQDAAEKMVSFKLANGTPKLQAYATSLQEVDAGSDHHTGGTGASETWIAYRLYMDGAGGYYLFQNGSLVGTIKNGPTGSSNTGAFRLAIKNGATAATYQVFVTPPVLEILY